VLPCKIRGEGVSFRYVFFQDISGVDPAAAVLEPPLMMLTHAVKNMTIALAAAYQLVNVIRIFLNVFAQR
jgi:hypothetical protein